MMAPLRVLLVEDNDDDVRLLQRVLEVEGLAPVVHRVEDAEAYRTALQSEAFDLVIADYTLPRFSGREALRILRDGGWDLPLIVVSGSIGEDAAVELMRAGANDYVLKANLRRLVPAIERELREAIERRERREAQERIRRMAYLDTLTGLPNRNRLDEHLAGVLAAGRPATVLVLDIERYTEVLHALGHTFADDIVRGLADRVGVWAAERGWLAARLTNRSLAVVAEPAEADDPAIARELSLQMEHTARLGEILVDVRPRVGMAVAPVDGSDAATLLRRADVALETARTRGARWARYDAERDPWSPRRLALISDLNRAADAGQLHLVYQPRIHLHRRRMEAVEALLRWRHPQHGLISPDQFIPLAESTGLIHPITEWVFGEAARQAREWRSRGRKLVVGVNVSPHTIHDLDLPTLLGRILDEHDLPADAFDLEITESVLVRDPVRARGTLRRLKDMGVRLYLDDFGTGYSSLGYLKTLPLHALKIDKAFVTGGLDDPGDMSIVLSTIQLAHNLGLEVVAEGVEHAETLARLTALRCDEAQGYFIGRPVLPRDLEILLQDNVRGRVSTPPPS